MSGVVEGTTNQIDKWSDKMLEGYNLTDKGIEVYSVGVHFIEINAVTKYRYRNFTIRRTKPMVDERILKSESIRDIYSFSGEDIEL